SKETACVFSGGRAEKETTSAEPERISGESRRCERLDVETGGRWRLAVSSLSGVCRRLRLLTRAAPYRAATVRKRCLRDVPESLRRAALARSRSVTCSGKPGGLPAEDPHPNGRAARLDA